MGILRTKIDVLFCYSVIFGEKNEEIGVKVKIYLEMSEKKCNFAANCCKKYQKQ